MFSMHLRLMLVLIALPSFAFAHGEEAVILALGQAALVILCALVFVVRRLPLPTRSAAFLGAVSGAVASWLISADLPFNANRSLITVMFIFFPVLGFVLPLLVAKVVNHARAKP